MLRKHRNRWLLIVVCVLLLSACIPYSFNPPKEVHINPGDSVGLAEAAVDAQGRSHIVGVVDDRIVYYRTRYGEPITSFAFTMSGSGDNWVQLWPGIAVTDDGTSYIVWTEQCGGPEKFACWSKITYIPPIGGWTRYCNPLDGNNRTTGNVRVVARGNKAYAVYDRMHTVEGPFFGRSDELMYKELTDPSNKGRVYSYIDHLESAFIYSLDLGIDSQGYLHVGLHENYATSEFERLFLHSNASADPNGDMAQHWLISDSNSIDEHVPVSLSFGKISGIEYVALTSVDVLNANVDNIWIDSCVSDGCDNKNSYKVVLPSSWDTYSHIEEVKIQGGDDYLDLGFIGHDDSFSNGQVYYKKAYSSDNPKLLSYEPYSSKSHLNMVSIVSRDPLYTGRSALTSIVWLEATFNIDSTYRYRFFTYDVPEFNKKVEVYEEVCSYPDVGGDIHSNGSYFSGVWYVCEDTWFSTQAWTNQLPLIMK